MTSIRQALQKAAACLKALPHSAPELEAAMLLCHLLGKPRSFLYAWSEHQLSEAQWQAYQGLLERRVGGEPVAHITGLREFWSLGLKITPATLIPRPETELLVERALHHLVCSPASLVADLGTGSGAIALAIASECPVCEVHATDRSAAALAVARENATQLNTGKVLFFLGNWFEALPRDARYDLILSNPPYIAEQDAHLHQGDLPHEPRSALVSGPKGLNDIQHLCAKAGRHLKSGGWLLLEHGFEQATDVRDLLGSAGFGEIRTHRDLAGHERISEGHWP